MFPSQNFPFVHHYFFGRVMCQLDIFSFEFRTVERCLVKSIFLFFFCGACGPDIKQFIILSGQSSEQSKMESCYFTLTHRV